MCHVLLINSDKPEPIRFLKEYKQKYNIYLSVLTRNRYTSIYNNFADEVYSVDDITDLSVSQLLVIDILENKKIDYIVTPTEKSVLTGGFLRSYYAINGPKFETTLCMTNKLAMKTKLQQVGIPVTDFKRLDKIGDLSEIGEELGWPLVLKPAMGTGTLNTFIVKSLKDSKNQVHIDKLDSLKKDKIPFLAEKYVEMEEYHCDALYNKGKLSFVSISKYFSPPLKVKHKLLGSYIIDQKNPIYKEILKIQESVINTFGVLDGPTHMEIYHTPSGELLVGEIALRVGGGGISDTIFKKYNVSMWDASLLIAINQDPQLKPKSSEGVFGWCGLPCQNGIIKDFTPLEELLKIPYVIDVQLHYELGENVHEKEMSTFHFGKIYFRLDNENQIEKFLNTVQEKFYLHTEKLSMSNL